MARGKKGGKKKDDFASDEDDGKFDLKIPASDEETDPVPSKKGKKAAKNKPTAVKPIEAAEDQITNNDDIAKPKKDRRGKSKKKNNDAGFDSDGDSDRFDPFAKNKNALSDNGDEDEEDHFAPKMASKKNKKKAAPVASFDLLAAADQENDSAESDKDMDIEQSMQNLSLNGKKKSKSKKKSSKDDSADEEKVSDNGFNEDLELKKKKRKSKTKEPEPEAEEAPAPVEDQDAPSLEMLGKKKKTKKKKEATTPEESASAETTPPKSNRRFIEADEEDEGKKKRDGEFQTISDDITATGILLSNDRSKDIQIDKFSLAAYGQQLIHDTSLNILYGRRYGLVSANGAGKSTLLRCLARREVPIQENMNIYLLEKEFDPTDMTAVEAVVDIVKQERDRLEEEMDELLTTVEGANSARFDYIQERLNELDISFAEQKARNVLSGLGFTAEMQDMKTSEFSGGWRMRVALARALFVKPMCLLLDDATNHLDLSAVVWLEDYLQNYPHTIILVSHSHDFLNGICTDILYLSNRKLDCFSGDYDTFVKVKAELDESARKKAKAEEKKMKKIKENLGRSGAQAKQAKSQEKALLKRKAKEAEKAGVIDEPPPMDGPYLERELTLRFQECGGGLPSPFLKFNDVSFAYKGRPQLYHDLNFGLDLESRVALVGPNGMGKTTLMKLMSGELKPTSGVVNRHHHLRIGRFHQHLTDQLDLSMSAVQWLCEEFNVKPQVMRGIVGRFGLTGKSQMIPMYQLSDGQKRRVVFAWLSQKNCHLLMLDEPTNHLDLETIDALAEGIREFDGGVVLISHDFRLIDQVVEEIWVVENGTVEEWDGDIRDYKEYLKTKTLGKKK